MHRLRLWGLSAALATVGGPALAGDPNMSPDQTTLVQKLFGPKQTKAAAPAPQSAPTITLPLPTDVLQKAVQAEQEAYLRRVGVCIEMRRIADEKGNPALNRQADELERRAAMIYNARVAALGVSKVKIPLPEPTTAMRYDDPVRPSTVTTAAAPAIPTSPSSVSTLPSDSSLSPFSGSSPREAAARLTAPAAPTPAESTAGIHEVKP